MASSKKSGRFIPLQTEAAEAWAWLRDYLTAIKHGQIHPFTSMERSVREATRNEPWGPTGTKLNELAEASFNSTDCQIIFAVIQLRLGYPPEKWRNVYKALVLLDFLVLRGSEQSVQITQEELMYKLEDLETFSYTTPEGKDQGVNVRHRAKAVKDLLLDTARLKSERQAFQRKRQAYQGYTRDQLASGKPFHDDQDIPTPSSGGGGLRRTLSDSSMQDSRHPSLDGHATTAPQQRNAGETKGVTMEMNKKQLAELKQLLDQPQNRYCADCTGGGAAARASWASINTGVFLCMRCAGVHRGLGTHISKVRSCTLDTWLPEQVAFMAQTGNDRANQYFEAKLERELKPAYGSVDLERFIRRKYAARAYAEGVWPPIGAQTAAAGGDVGGPAEFESAGSAEEKSLEAGAADAVSAADAAPLTKRAQPLLPGRRPARQPSTISASAKPLARLVSVPLPPPARSRDGSSAAAEPPKDPVTDLMAFGSGESPYYSAPAKPLSQPQPQPQPRDVFADLEALVPSVSLLDSDRGFGTAASGAVGAVPAAQEPSAIGSVPPAFSSISLPAQPEATWPQHTHSTSLPAGQYTATASLANGGGLLAHSQASSQPDPAAVSFQDESVTDWGQPAAFPRPPAAPRLAPLHIRSGSVGRNSDIGSVASTPFLTPRFTALYGPGPSQAVHIPPQAQAPMRYIPPDLSRSSWAQPNGRLAAVQNSALAQATKQWTANSKQGEKGVLDDLVLHAMAGLPPSKRGNLQDAMAAGQAQKPPSMLQQRAELMQQT